MKGLIKSLSVLGASCFLFGVASAQQGSVGTIPVVTGDEGAPPDWYEECSYFGSNTNPLSVPYLINFVANDLMWCAMGGGGTWTAGGSKGPCFAPSSAAAPNQGKFAFSYGSYSGGLLNNQESVPVATASVQQYSANFRDAGMAINYGAPFTPSQCFANFVIDGTPNYFGSTLVQFYVGQSNRYMTYIATVQQFTIDLQVELVADAVRFRWTCTNNDTASHSLALWFGSGIEMLTDQNQKYWQTGSYAIGNFGTPFIDNNQGIGPDESGEPVNSIGGFTNFNRLPREDVPFLADELFNTQINGYNGIYIYVPNQRPPNQDTIYTLGTNAALFPDYADFVFGESDPFGIRIETKPSASTNDPNPTNLPTKANQLTVGKQLFLLGALSGATPIFQPTNILADTGFLDQPAFVIEYEPVTVNAGTTTQILNYVRSTWGNGNYAIPFGAVVDAPAVVQAGSTNFDGTTATSGLVNNTTSDPVRIRVWIDNVGGNVTSGYGVKNKEFTLDDVQVNISFGVPGVTIINNNGSGTQIIPSIGPRTENYVEFDCTLAQAVIGDIPYTVTITTVPINTKTITGTINVAGRPQTVLYPGANLISAPYTFTDTSWLTVLEDFVPGAATKPFSGTVSSTANFQTYVWDATSNEYRETLSVQPGQPVWVVYNNPTAVFAPYEGSPSLPQGYANATYQIELKPGWNLISDPFNIEFPINQINGVAAGNSSIVETFDELVGLGYVSGYVANYNPSANANTGAYVYTDGTTGLLQPNVGYWIEDLLPGDITLSFPPLYTEGTPGSYNSSPTLTPGAWRLGLSARQGLASDNNVTVGTAANLTAVREGTIYKAPMSPTQSLSLAILGSQGNKTVQLHQALTTNAASYGWLAQLSSTKVGPVSLTWPNTSTVPRTMGMFLQDQTSGITLDMRTSSSYNYEQLTPGAVREFKVIVTTPVDETGLVGTISGSALKLGATEEEKITYTLSETATTTTKILSSTGAVVATLHSDRVDRAGAAEDLWNLKTSTGAAVPAGKYTVQIFAVTATGHFQTKTAIITVA
jgi:hypothetical protein